MAAYVEAPSQFSGTEMARIGQIYTYLYKLHEQLNIALQKLDSGDFSAAGQAQIEKTVQQIADTQTAGEYTALRSMIVKNANIVRSEMDELVTQFAGDYVAQSDFGEYRQSVEATYVTNALYSETTTRLTESVDAYADFYANMNGRIRSGIIGANPDGTYLYGIAVGQNITTEDVEGSDVPRIIKKDFLAIYAANKLEFYQNDALLASIEGDTLSVGAIRVAGSIEQGSWKWDSRNGLALLWIGGE